MSRRALILSIAVVGFSHTLSAQPKMRPPGAPTPAERCEALLDSAGFANRYEMIGGLTKVTACTMRGLVEESLYDSEVSPRLQSYIRLCYTADEQPYLRSVVQRGVIQAMPYLSQGGCDSTLERVLRLDERAGVDRQPTLP